MSEGGIEYQRMIAGKRVTLRRRIPNREGHALPRLMAEYTGDYNDLGKLGQILIESWEFAGDPRQADAYGDLDVFDEMRPLGSFLVDYIQARMKAVGELKN